MCAKELILYLKAENPMKKLIFTLTLLNIAIAHSASDEANRAATEKYYLQKDKYHQSPGLEIDENQLSLLSLIDDDDQVSLHDEKKKVSKPKINNSYDLKTATQKTDLANRAATEKYYLQKDKHHQSPGLEIDED